MAVATKVAAATEVVAVDMAAMVALVMATETVAAIVFMKEAAADAVVALVMVAEAVVGNRGDSGGGGGLADTKGQLGRWRLSLSLSLVIQCN